MRHPITSLCMIALALAACSESVPPLTLAEKARFTSELIADRPACAVFVEKLSPVVTDEKLIAQTYEAARAAHCLKPNV